MLRDVCVLCFNELSKYTVRQLHSATGPDSDLMPATSVSVKKDLCYISS